MTNIPVHVSLSIRISKLGLNDLHIMRLTWMLRSFFLPLSSRLSSLRCRCSAGCSSRSSTETVFLKSGRLLAHAGEAPPSSAAGGLLAPPPPSPLAAAPEPGSGGSGDQKSRCTVPGREKPETPAVTEHHTRTESSSHTRYK